MTDRCEMTDLRRTECAHCGAAPGTRITFVRARAALAVVRHGGRDVFPEPPMPTATNGALLRHVLSSHASVSRCQVCDRPTRDNAYGCDACADRLRMAFADAPWWLEQLEITMTKQQANLPGSGGRGSSGTILRREPDGTTWYESPLPWREDAADLRRALYGQLIETIGICARDKVRHQWAYFGLPTKRPESMSTWLLWRVDGLTLHQAFGEILAGLEDVQEKAERLIDRRPDRLFLGKCRFAMVCGGVVYAKAGEKVATCKACGEQYDVDEKRDELEQALDDRLMTAAEIATCATYLGIPADRDVVRRRVNRWHSAGVIKAASWIDEGGVRTPRFRYGDVLPRLAATYQRKEG